MAVVGRGNWLCCGAIRRSEEASQSLDVKAFYGSQFAERRALVRATLDGGGPRVSMTTRLYVATAEGSLNGIVRLSPSFFR